MMGRGEHRCLPWDKEIGLALLEGRCTKGAEMEIKPNQDVTVKLSVDTKEAGVTARR